MGALEALTIILSVVSLVISVVAFFASLKFYRDGVELQQKANDALTKISEKTEFIQTQVGGMFDKTLDAAIGKREILSAQFEELNEQLEKTKFKLIEESIGQIGAAGEKERNRLTNLVDVQMALVREKVKTTRESAQEMVTHTSYLATLIFAVLSAAEESLTVSQVQDRIIKDWKTHIPTGSLTRRLKNMANSGEIVEKDDKFTTY